VRLAGWLKNLHGQKKHNTVRMDVKRHCVKLMKFMLRELPSMEKWERNIAL